MAPWQQAGPLTLPHLEGCIIPGFSTCSAAPGGHDWRDGHWLRQPVCFRPSGCLAARLAACLPLWLPVCARTSARTRPVCLSAHFGPSLELHSYFSVWWLRAAARHMALSCHAVFSVQCQVRNHYGVLFCQSAEYINGAACGARHATGTYRKQHLCETIPSMYLYFPVV